tara:strand:+ start:741 stop:1214 length:474 start_codon:yes stop_codon:yes gene_type:complete
MRECSKCHKEKGDDQFSKNRYKVDGLSDRCKVCSSEITQDRRRRLDVMLMNCPKQFVIKFRKLHKQWEGDGHPPHLKPVVVNSQCMTHIESKGIVRKRRIIDVCLVDGDGVVISTFDNLSHAQRETGDSKIYIKWSASSGSRSDGRNGWKISGGEKK